MKNTPHRGWYILVTLLWPVYMTIAVINGMVEGLLEGQCEWQIDRAQFKKPKR